MYKKYIIKSSKKIRKKVIIINATETISLISKPWCSLNDLIKLTGLGRNKALDIRNNIISYLENNGYKIVSKKLLPMDAVVKYLEIDIDYLKNIISID